MYKKIIFSICFCIVSFAFAYYQWERLRDVKAAQISQEQNRLRINNIEKKLKTLTISNNIFLPIKDFKKQIQTILIKNNLCNCKIEGDQIFSISGEIDSERNLHNLFWDLYFNTNGFIQFLSVKIIKHKNLLIKIDGRIESFSIPDFLVQIKQISIPNDIPNIFSLKRNKKILAISGDQQVFISGQWYKTGDEVCDGAKIIDINQNQVQILIDNKKETFFIDDEW